MLIDLMILYEVTLKVIFSLIMQLKFLPIWEIQKKIPILVINQNSNYKIFKSFSLKMY